MLARSVLAAFRPRFAVQCSRLLSTMQVGDRVVVRYTAFLPEAKTVDTGEETEIEYIAGDGQMVAGFEKGVGGLEIGESARLDLESSEAFGDWNPDHVMKIARNQLPAGAIRAVYRLQMNAEGQMGKVLELTDEMVHIDLNHELAGQSVSFHVTLLEHHPSGYDSIQIAQEILAGDAMTFPLPGDDVMIHYTGYASDGTQFDCSLKRGKPLKFTVGEGKVISGLEEAIIRMSIGQKLVLQIPGTKGAKGLGGKFEFKPPFPPEGDIELEVELLHVARHPLNMG